MNAMTEMTISQCGECDLLKFDSQMDCYYCGHSGKAEDTCPKSDAIDEAVSNESK